MELLLCGFGLTCKEAAGEGESQGRLHIRLVPRPRTNTSYLGTFSANPSPSAPSVNTIHTTAPWVLFQSALEFICSAAACSTLANPPIRQSINPSIHQSVNPSIRQSINPIRQSINLRRMPILRYQNTGWRQSGMLVLQYNSLKLPCTGSPAWPYSCASRVSQEFSHPMESCILNYKPRDTRIPLASFPAPI